MDFQCCPPEPALDKMAKDSLTVLLAFLTLIFPASALAQEKLPAKSSTTDFKPQIIPPHPDAIGGGNPFQGLGRPDDPGKSRVEDFLESLSPGKTTATKSPDNKKPSKGDTKSNTRDKEEDKTKDKEKRKKKKSKVVKTKLSDQRLALQLVQKRKISRGTFNTGKKEKVTSR